MMEREPDFRIACRTQHIALTIHRAAEVRGFRASWSSSEGDKVYFYTRRAQEWAHELNALIDPNNKE